MALGTLLIIAVVVAALGSLSTQFFRSAGSPYLISVRGSKSQLIVAGVLIWSAAIAAGLVSLVIVASVASNIVAVALFFGVEAIALDICAHRIQYHRVEHPGLERVRIEAHIRS